MFLFKKDRKTHLSKQQREELSLSDKEYKELKETFAFFDKDHSGFIEANELESALRMMGDNPTPESVAAMIRRADTVCQDGKVEFLEFCQLMRSMGRCTMEKECKQLFHIIDKDVSGFINLEELKHALSEGGYKVSEEEVVALFVHADKDEDGLISFQEFVNLMLANSSTTAACSHA